MLLLVFILMSSALVNSYSILEKGDVVPKKPFYVKQLAKLGGPPPQVPFQDGEKPTPKQSSCSNQNYALAAGQTKAITSQNYPYNYKANSDCSYYFTSPTGTTMTVTCEINISCGNGDYIYFSLDGDGSDEFGYCGYGTTDPETSNSNSLSIGFWSSPYYLYNVGYNYKCYVTASPSSSVSTTPSPGSTTTVAPGSTTTSAPGSCSCGVLNPTGATKIVGGNQTYTGEIPWRVQLVLQDSSGSGYLCGGTIISPSWIMTAAHCTDGQNLAAGDLIDVYTEAQGNPVTVGGGVKNSVDRFVQHPSYNSNTMNNDISLLHLRTPLKFKSNVSPACLPYNLVGSTFSGLQVLASGWGTTKPVPVGSQNNDAVSNTLMQVTLPVLSTTECQQYLGTAVSQNMICTYLPGKDTCQGDSGGSIDNQSSNSFFYAIGVVSWGYGCAQTRNPGVYTKVTNYLPWIETTTGDSFCKP